MPCSLIEERHANARSIVLQLYLPSTEAVAFVNVKNALNTQLLLSKFAHLYLFTSHSQPGGRGLQSLSKTPLLKGLSLLPFRTAMIR